MSEWVIQSSLFHHIGYSFHAITSNFRNRNSIAFCPYAFLTNEINWMLSLSVLT
jgi:hypothetical protein